MRHSILHTAGNVVWVARNARRDALPLLATYSRLKLQEIFASRGQKDWVMRTRILDLDVAFFDYYWLIDMFEEIFLRRQYLFETKNPNPVIVDAGSNIGLSILFFKTLFPSAKVIGFEPDPEAFEVLTRNVRENRLENVSLLNLAVHDGRNSVYLFGDPGVPGSPQESARSERMAGARAAVGATRLSTYVTDPVDFLKIDVEGVERIVIEELEQSGKLPLVDRIAIEYHHHLDPDEDALSEMLSTLERNGFGYQLEARLAGSGGSYARGYQNVLVHAYRKRATPARSSGDR
jgi:FkbM family methyltransferase